MDSISRQSGGVDGKNKVSRTRQERAFRPVPADAQRLSHAIGLLDEWQQAGVKPICYQYPMLDLTDEAGIGKVMAAMLAWMAQQEREMIRRRIKAGLAASRAKPNTRSCPHCDPQSAGRGRRLR